MSANQPTVSIVVPLYNEVDSLRELHARINEELLRLNLYGEIIFVDDGSTDGSRELLAELAADDPACRVITLRRNCGKAQALRAGFDAVQGEYILTMDADLQDDPAEISRFLVALQSADIVCGWKVVRHDPVGKTLPSRIFNAVVRDVTGIKLHDMNCGFKGYRRQVIEEIPLYGDLHRYIPVFAAARGFRIAELPVIHHPRRHGVSKFGWERIPRGFFDLMTVVYVTKYRQRPMHLFGGVGLSLCFLGIVFGGVMSIFADVYDFLPWRSFFWMIAFVLLTVGVLLFALGLLAEGQLAAGKYPTPSTPVANRLNFEQRAMPVAANEARVAPVAVDEEPHAD